MDSAALAQVARHLERLDSRVHVLETLSRPQARNRLNEIFTTPLSVASVLWLEKSMSQTHLATLVSDAIGERVRQETVSRELRRLRDSGVLGQATSRHFYVEPAWAEFGLERDLRRRAGLMGVKVEAQRRPSNKSRRGEQKTR